MCFATRATGSRSASRAGSPAPLFRVILTGLLTFTPGVCFADGVGATSLPPPPRLAAREPSRQDADAPPALAAVERELKGGESHSYRVTLAAGQFLGGLVEQEGIDVEVVLFDPAGRQLSVADGPNDLWGPEPIVLVTETAGDYRVVVRASNPKAAPGRYEVKPFVVREATDADRQHVAAERLFAEGQKLRTSHTPGWVCRSSLMGSAARSIRTCRKGSSCPPRSCRRSRRRTFTTLTEAL